MPEEPSIYARLFARGAFIPGDSELARYQRTFEEDLGWAITLFQLTLDGQQRVLGEDDPDTLISYNNLAAAYEASGDLERAIPLYQQALDGRVRVLGKDHPHTLISRERPASAYQAAGLGQGGLGRVLRRRRST